MKLLENGVISLKDLRQIAYNDLVAAVKATSETQNGMLKYVVTLSNGEVHFVFVKK